MSSAAARPGCTRGCQTCRAAIAAAASSAPKAPESAADRRRLPRAHNYGHAGRSPCCHERSPLHAHNPSPADYDTHIRWDRNSRSPICYLSAGETQYWVVVPPKSNRLIPWQYNHELYKKRIEVERMFRRLKGFRRIFSRFEKLDVVFLAFLHFALIVEALRIVRTRPGIRGCIRWPRPTSAAAGASMPIWRNG